MAEQKLKQTVQLLDPGRRLIVSLDLAVRCPEIEHLPSFVFETGFLVVSEVLLTQRTAKALHRLPAAALAGLADKVHLRPRVESCQY